MRVVRLALSLALIFQTSSQLHAQQSAIAVQRDPQAIATLTQTIMAAGGAKVSSIQDFTGTGVITYNWAGEATSGSVRLYGKGPSQFRMDSTVPAGLQSLVIVGHKAILVPAHAAKTDVPIRATVCTGNLTLPGLRIAQALADSSISVVYVGLVAWNGSQAHQIHVVLPIDSRLVVSPTFSGLGEFDLYFDPNSTQLLGLAEKIWWDDDLRQPYLHELIFSNYQLANSVAVPYTITEKMGGQQTWSITLDSLAFNTGLSDDVFQIQGSENSGQG